MKADPLDLRTSWRAELRRIAKSNQPPDCKILTRTIYTGPVIYLPAITGVCPTMNQPDNIMPMFEESAELVYTVFYDGAISVTLKGQLTKIQVRAFIAGACNIAGVRACQLDNCQAHSSENTCFLVDMRPGAATRANDIRMAVQAMAERFMSELQPAAAQTSLF